MWSSSSCVFFCARRLLADTESAERRGAHAHIHMPYMTHTHITTCPYNATSATERRGLVPRWLCVVSVGVGICGLGLALSVWRLTLTSTVDPDSQTQAHAPSARQVARRLTRRNLVCEVQWAIPDVHCAVDLYCGYNAILQRHLHTRICQSPIPLPLTHCLLHMRPETAQTLLSRLPQTTNTWRMHSITPNIPT